MRQEAMVPHADAEAAGYPPQESCQNQILPTEEEQGSESPDVEHNHEECGDRINPVAVFRLEYQVCLPCCENGIAPHPERVPIR
jgi:hypothetical protein